jgi:hypothetical protein
MAAAAAPSWRNEEVGDLGVALHLSRRQAFGVMVGIAVFCAVCVAVAFFTRCRALGRRCAEARGRRRVHPELDGGV